MRAAPSISSSYRKGLSEKRDEWRYSAKIYPMSLANDPFSPVAHLPDVRAQEAAAAVLADALPPVRRGPGQGWR